MRKVRSSQSVILVLNWIKQSFSLWVSLWKKADRNFHGNFLKNHFRGKYLKLYSNPQVDWPEVVVIWAPFHIFWLTLPPQIINKPWISRKNDKAIKIMRKTQILLWKTIESNRRLRVRVRFLLIYFELALTDPWCNVLRPWLYLVGKNMRRQCQMNTLYAKDWSSHFWKSQPFRFWYVEVHCQRRLKSTKTGISS